MQYCFENARMWERIIAYRVLVEGNRSLEDAGEDGRITLRWIFSK